MYFLSQSGVGLHTRADDIQLGKLAPCRVAEESSKFFRYVGTEESSVAVGKLVELVSNSLGDLLVAVA
jgi:hypothetical protein